MAYGNVIAYDEVLFEIGDISPIREDDIYGGYRVKITAKYDTITTPFCIDVSTASRKNWSVE